MLGGSDPLGGPAASGDRAGHDADAGLGGLGDASHRAAGRTTGADAAQRESSFAARYVDPVYADRNGAESGGERGHGGTNGWSAGTENAYSPSEQGYGGAGSLGARSGAGSDRGYGGTGSGPEAASEHGYGGGESGYARGYPEAEHSPAGGEQRYPASEQSYGADSGAPSGRSRGRPAASKHGSDADLTTGYRDPGYPTGYRSPPPSPVPPPANSGHPSSAYPGAGSGYPTTASGYPSAPPGYPTGAPYVPLSGTTGDPARAAATALVGGRGAPGAAGAGLGSDTGTFSGVLGSPSRQGVRGGRTPAGARPPRRARLLVRHIDPWSTLKFSLVLAVALFFVWLVAVGVLYGVLDGMGVFDKINSLYDQLSGNSNSRIVTPGLVLGFATLIGAINIVLMTALATIGSFVYNICADLVGGIEITLAERD